MNQVFRVVKSKMKSKLIFKKVVKLISIPVMVLVLSMYLPDIYPCTKLMRIDLTNYVVDMGCVFYVMSLQLLLWVVASMFTIVLFVGEFYQFRMSLDKKGKSESI